MQALRDWRARQLQERLRAREAWNDGERVVTDELGVPIHPDWPSNFFARAKEAGSPQITIRQLRHSHATALLRAGSTHPKVVQERFGHSSMLVEKLDIGGVPLAVGNIREESLIRTGGRASEGANEKSCHLGTGYRAVGAEEAACLVAASGYLGGGDCLNVRLVDTPVVV